MSVPCVLPLASLVALAVVVWVSPGVLAEEPPTQAEADAATEPVPPNRTRITGRPGFTPKVGGLPLTLSLPRTAEDVLRLAPGVVVVQHGAEGKAHQLYLRGFDALHGADLEVELEGVRLNEAGNVHATGYFDLALVPVSLVSSLALDKGPYSLDQGLFGTAGTARYRLGVPDDRRGATVGYELGTTNRHRVTFSLAPESLRDDSFIGAELITDQGFGERRAVRRVAVAARVAPPPRGPDSLSFLFALGLARFELPGLLADADLDSGLVDFHGAYDDLSFGESDRVLGLMRHVHEGDQAHVETVMHVGWRGLMLRENFTGFLLDPVRGDARRQTESRVHAGLSSSATLELAALTLELHAGLRVDELSQAVENVDSRDLALALERSLDAALIEGWLAPGLRLASGPFTARAGLRAVLLGDLRTDTDDTELAPLPRVDLGLHHAAWTFRLAYGRGARPPDSRAALTLSDSVELGARVRVDRLEASLVGFFTAVGRESVFDHASGQSLALDGSRRLGLELALVVAPIDRLRLRLDLTISDARYDRSGRSVAGVPPLVASLQAELDHAPWRVFVRALALSSRPLPFGATGEGLFDLSLGADWTHGPVRVGLTVDNVFDLDQRAGVYHFASRWDPRAPPTSLSRLHFAAGPPLSARLTLELRP